MTGNPHLLGLMQALKVILRLQLALSRLIRRRVTLPTHQQSYLCAGYVGLTFWNSWKNSKHRDRPALVSQMSREWVGRNCWGRGSVGWEAYRR